MDFDLNDDQRAIRETARALLAERAASGSNDEDVWREVVALGWPGIAVDEAHGGQGLGVVELCVLLEEQGRALVPGQLLPSTAAALAIARSGSAAQRERWLPALAGGDAYGAVGWAAPGRPALVAGGEADVIVLVEPDGCALVEASEATVTAVATIDPLRRYALVEGEAEPLPGDSARARDEAGVAVAAELLGVAQRALDLTLAYVKERKQFGVPVGSFQAVAHRCAEMLLQTESARSVVYHAAWAADAAPERLPEAAALAQFVAAEAAVEVTAAAIQAHGGIGFTWEADIHWWYKRAQLSAQLLGGAGHHRARLGERLAA